MQKTHNICYIDSMQGDRFPVVADSRQAAIDGFLAERPFYVIACEKAFGVEIEDNREHSWTVFRVHGQREDGSVKPSSMEYLVAGPFVNDEKDVRTFADIAAAVRKAEAKIG